MSINLNIFSEDEYPAFSQPDAFNPNPAGEPAGMNSPAPMNPNAGDPNPSITNMPGQDDMVDDISDDPDFPDMPEDEEQAEEIDFEVWKKNYFKATIKGDTEELLDLLQMVRSLEGLDDYQNKFVEDNFNIQLIRRLSNVDKASKELRRNLQSSLDKNAPTVSVVNNLVAILETAPMLNEILIKLEGYKSLKGDLHRKFIAALLGAVQVGSGYEMEDIIYNEREYSISISTRLNARWGNVVLGPWSLKEDDPYQYLKDAELERLRSGSPEEKQVLRRRIVIESISSQFSDRGFVIQVVSDDGTTHSLGWDLGASIKNAYNNGKLVVRTRKSDNSEAMITDDGKIVPMIDLSIDYMHNTGQVDANGDPIKERKEFLERRNGMLFLVADVNTIKEAGTAFSGAVFNEQPYNGNPSDIPELRKCVYSAYDLLNRQC